MIRNIVKRAMYLLLAAALLLSVPLTVNAAQSNFDLNQTGSIQITLRDQKYPEDTIGGTLELFRVADAVTVDSNLSFVLTAEFAGSGVTLTDVNASGLPQQLAAYAKNNALTGISVQADKHGNFSFTGLSAGLYLVTQSQTEEGYYPVAPFLVSMPMYSAEQGGWLYTIEASPKVQRPSQEPVSLTVVKKWKDNDYGRPAALTVKLLRNGKVDSSVTLTAKEGWKYTWTGLDANYRWTAEEVVPNGYRARYSTYGQTVTITNTASWYVPPTNELKQTGQLNWPVPVLLCAGLSLLAVGCVLLRKDRGEK